MTDCASCGAVGVATRCPLKLNGGRVVEPPLCDECYEAHLSEDWIEAEVPNE